jgi:hypothetical protein
VTEAPTDERLDHLTEINVTSPAGLRPINRLEGTQLEATVIDLLPTRRATCSGETTHQPAHHASTGRRRRATVHASQGAVMPWPSPSLS